MTTTRDILIDEATELFLGRGYGVVGTAQLCAAAGVNKGTFYHYFPSKSDLLVAVIERYAASFASEFVRIADSNAAPEEKLKRFFEAPAKANRQWKAKHGFAQGCLVGNMSLELGSIDEAARAAIERAFASWRPPIKSVIGELIADGALDPIDETKGADVVIALIQGGLLLAKAQNDPSKVVLLASGALAHLNSQPR